MRNFIEVICEGTHWFEKGTPVNIIDWDASHYLEDEEFSMDWRLCMVPSDEVEPALLDPEESEARISAIEKWAHDDVEENLKKYPPIMLLKTMQIIDGNHRTFFAKKHGLKNIPMLVGN